MRVIWAQIVCLKQRLRQFQPLCRPLRPSYCVKMTWAAAGSLSQHAHRNGTGLAQIGHAIIRMNLTELPASATMTTILIADDEPKLLKMLQRTLAYEGFRVFSASDGNAALAELQAHRPDVLVLDWLMPGMDGIGVLEHLRAAGDKTLVLMLTTRDAVENRVEGPESGADDYLVKPFAPAELLARLHALLRRPAVVARDEALVYADLHLDPLARETRRGSRVFDLTAKEYDLLHYLLRHPRRVLQREQILQDVWGYDFGGDDNEEVDRLIRLVNQLLVLARADAGQMLRSDPIPVRSLIDDACRQAKVLSPHPQLLCEAPVEVDGPVLVQGDRDALKQVLLILVDNALVHTPVRTPVVLRAAATDTGIVFQVSDSGPGIDPEALPHIFECFYRGQDSRTGRNAGLGLAIARELVEAQGGAIMVQSQPGQGAVFTVTLDPAPADQRSLG